MKLTTVEAKKLHSFNYLDYFTTYFYYQCIGCSEIVEYFAGHCPECTEKLDLNNRQQLFCCECRHPIEEKRDYIINERDLVSHSPVNYLKCQCSENLWIPFEKTDNFPIPVDPDTGIEELTEDNIEIWVNCCAEPSQYNNNEGIFFINCPQREQEIFLRAYIEFNIDKNGKLPISERKEFSDRYYRICRDVISLGIKLGILRELIRDESIARRIDARSPNTIQEILDFSGARFKYELLTSILENCFARLRRLFNPTPEETENTFGKYREHFLKTFYTDPEEYESERKKYGIGKLDGHLIALINKEVLHDDIGFDKGIFIKDCKTLFKFYEKKVLKAINALNDMHQFKLHFNYEDSLNPLGLENTGRDILLSYLGIADNALTLYKQKKALELLGLDNIIDNEGLSPEKRKECERKRNSYESNLRSYFRRWIVFSHDKPLNIITPEGQSIEMPYGFSSMRLTITHTGDYIIYIKTPGVTLCPNYRIECFDQNEKYAKQVFREIQRLMYKEETVDLNDFKYNSSTILF